MCTCIPWRPFHCRFCCLELLHVAPWFAGTDENARSFKAAYTAYIHGSRCSGHPIKWSSWHIDTKSDATTSCCSFITKTSWTCRPSLIKYCCSSIRHWPVDGNPVCVSFYLFISWVLIYLLMLRCVVSGLLPEFYFSPIDNVLIIINDVI